MSRIGKKPVKVPSGVTVSINGGQVSVTGPKGALSFSFRPEVKIEQEGSDLIVNRVAEPPKAKALHGLSRTILENMVQGVSTGWNKGLELVGVGYRVSLEGTGLVLNVG